jgi:hypothetical protein
MAKYTDEAKRLAIQLVLEEKSKWEDEVCWVTEKVGFKMRDLIRYFRKNYWGVFDSPIDPITQREKIWIPLTRSLIEDAVKNVDLDSKDIGFKAKTKDGFGITDFVRSYVREKLDKMHFGEVLDETQRQLFIDGTVVWKTWEENGKPKRKTVELLNLYLDPTEDNLQKAYRVTERSISTPEEIASMTGWKNTEDIKGSTDLSKTDGDDSQATTTTGELTDVWELWGYIPKFLITGSKKDKGMIPNGHIIVSGLDSGDMRVHLIETYTRQDEEGCYIKPYEELRIAKVSGRFYGIGFAEALMALQEGINLTANIRLNRNVMAQLGLFKIRKGAGVTAQQLSRLPSNGAITLDNLEDIEQFNINPVDNTSYQDEEVFKEWATKTTQAFPVTAGEALPASSSATAVAIQSTNAKSTYTIIKEAIGMFLERWIDRQYLPILAKGIKKGDVIKFSSDDAFFKEIVDRVVLQYAREAIDNSPTLPTEQELSMAVDSARERLSRSPQLFMELVQEIVAESLETDVRITNEDLDTSVTVQNLKEMLAFVEDKEPIMRQIFDLLNLPMPKMRPPQMSQVQGQMPQEQTMPDMQNLTEQAVLPQV